jgi:hypothetical protein
VTDLGAPDRPEATVPRTSRRSIFERRYGGSPGHLLSMVLGLSFAGYVISILAGVGHSFEILAWVAGAIVAHDLVLFPLYTAVDHASHLIARRQRATPAVPWRNHVRAPFVISALLMAMTFPLVFGLSEGSYLRATGLTTGVYAGHLVIVCGVLFVGSGAIYLLRFLLASRHRGTRRARGHATTER